MGAPRPGGTRGNGSPVGPRSAAWIFPDHARSIAWRTGTRSHGPRKLRPVRCSWPLEDLRRIIANGILGVRKGGTNGMRCPRVDLDRSTKPEKSWSIGPVAGVIPQTRKNKRILLMSSALCCTMMLNAQSTPNMSPAGSAGKAHRRQTRLPEGLGRRIRIDRCFRRPTGQGEGYPEPLQQRMRGRDEGVRFVGPSRHGQT